MGIVIGSTTYSEQEKNRRALFLKQKQTLDLFLEKNAISKQQYEKSLHDLAEKMGFITDLQTERK